MQRRLFEVVREKGACLKVFVRGLRWSCWMLQWLSRQSGWCEVSLFSLWCNSFKLRAKAVRFCADFIIGKTIVISAVKLCGRWSFTYEAVNCSSQVNVYRSNHNLKDPLLGSPDSQGSTLPLDSWPTSDVSQELSGEGLDSIRRELDSVVMTKKVIN